MGKKTIVGYGFYINPAFAAALYDYGTRIVNTQHEFFAERVLKKGVALGVSAKLYKSTYNNTNVVELGLRSRDYLTEDRSPTGNYQLKARNYAFYFKLFKRYYVAPWGKYFLLGITVNKYKATYSSDKMFVPVKEYTNIYSGSYVSSEFNDFGPNEQLFQYVDFMIGNGNSRIFGNKFVLEYGYNLNVVAATLVFMDAFDNGSTTASNYIQKTSISRIRGINRFNFFLKVGYLF